MFKKKMIIILGILFTSVNHAALNYVKKDSLKTFAERADHVSMPDRDMLTRSGIMDFTVVLLQERHAVLERNVQRRCREIELLKRQQEELRGDVEKMNKELFQLYHQYVPLLKLEELLRQKTRNFTDRAFAITDSYEQKKLEILSQYQESRRALGEVTVDLSKLGEEFVGVRDEENACRNKLYLAMLS